MDGPLVHSTFAVETRFAPVEEFGSLIINPKILQKV
jgi:hypothetical protein